MVNEKKNRELEAKLRKQREHFHADMRAKEIKLRRVKEALDAEVIVRPVEAEVENVRPPTPKTPDSSRRNMTPYSSRRRSRSTDGVWLEHNAIKPVPLGTVMQPTMKKLKSVSKLTKATDVTNPKRTKYCLLAQEQDTDGEIETKLYKGDIVPTCGGGAQVIFNDVERLRQESPTRDD